MKVLALGSMLFSMFMFTSCSSMSKGADHSCCVKNSSVCKDGCKTDKSCCDDKCGECDGKSSCSEGSCDNAKKA
jgi:hypothetical protein